MFGLSKNIFETKLACEQNGKKFLPTQLIWEILGYKFGSILMSHESGLTPHEKVLIPHVSGFTPLEIEFLSHEKKISINEGNFTRKII